MRLTRGLVVFALVQSWLRFLLALYRSLIRHDEVKETLKNACLHIHFLG